MTRGNLEGAPLLEARGEIDHSTCGSVEAKLRELLDEQHGVVLLDLEQVTYIDSGGLSVLLSVVRRLRGAGWLGVIGPNKNVRRLLEIVGLLLDPDFRVFADRETAAAAVADQVRT